MAIIDNIKTEVSTVTIKVRAANSHSTTLGGGVSRWSAQTTLQMILRVPDRPVLGLPTRAISPADQSIVLLTVAWPCPANGGAAISRFEVNVQFNGAGDGDWEPLAVEDQTTCSTCCSGVPSACTTKTTADACNAATDCTWTSRAVCASPSDTMTSKRVVSTPGIYSFRVSATNNVGSSELSEPVEIEVCAPGSKVKGAVSCTGCLEGTFSSKLLASTCTSCPSGRQ